MQIFDAPWAQQNRFSAIWTVMLLFASGSVLFILPYDVIFPDHDRGIDVAMDLLVACLFMADCVLYFGKNKELSPGTGMRFFEIFSALPLLLPFALVGQDTGFVLLVQLNHLTRLPLILKRVQWQAANTLVGKGYKTSILIGGSVVAIHWLACGHVLAFPHEPVGHLTQYNLALYWTITTLTTVGYGDITPVDNFSRTYTMMTMLLGVGFYGLIISQISQYMLKKDRRREQEIAQLDSLASLFKHYSIPEDLQNATLKFFRHIVAKANYEDELKVLKILPEPLAAQIKLHMSVKPLSRLSVFQGCSIGCLADAAQMMRQVFFAPGDQIIKKGEQGECMFVVLHGTVDVHEGDYHIAQLEDGQSFGEMALISDKPRISDVTAVTYCDMLTLSKEAFQQLVYEHADLRANVAHIFAQRRQSA